MPRYTDNVWDHVTLPPRWLAVIVVGVVATVLLWGCGDMTGPCGCPFGTVCQPDSAKMQGYVCVVAPKATEPTAVDAVKEAE